MLRIGILTTFRQQGPYGRELRAVELEGGQFVLDNPEYFTTVPDGTPVLCRYVLEDQFAAALTDTGLTNLEPCVGNIRDLNHA